MMHFLIRCDGLLILSLCALVGCSANADSTGGGNGSRSDSATAERIEQIKQIGQQHDFESAPQLIDAMEDDSSEVREAAFAAAIEVLGHGIQIRHYESVERRHEAVEAYRRLYALAQEAGVEHVIDTVPALIDLLESDDAESRQQAYEDLVRVTGMSVEFRSDDSPEKRQLTANKYRQLWQTWNQPGNMILEWRRHPELMRQYKRERLEEVKRRIAESGR